MILKEIINTLITILIILLLLILLCMIIRPAFSTENLERAENKKLDFSKIEKVCRKVGPYYDYRIFPDGTLQVNKGDGKWLNVRY